MVLRPLDSLLAVLTFVSFLEGITSLAVLEKKYLARVEDGMLCRQANEDSSSESGSSKKKKNRKKKNKKKKTKKAEDEDGKVCGCFADTVDCIFTFVTIIAFLLQLIFIAVFIFVYTQKNK